LLTVPQPPKLSTEERMKLRDEMAVAPSEQEDPVLFKARPFNRKIFEKKPDKPVEKKEAT